MNSYQERTNVLIDLMTYRDLAAKKMLAIPDLWTPEGKAAYDEWTRLSERVDTLEKERQDELQRLKRRHGIID